MTTLSQLIADYKTFTGHVRRQFHPGYKCHSPHYRGPCLSIRPHKDGSDVKLIKFPGQYWFYVNAQDKQNFNMKLCVQIRH